MDDAALDEIHRHREARNRRLKAPDGWLSLVARHVLFDGENRFAVPGGEALARVERGDVTVQLPDGRQHVWRADATDPASTFVVDAQRFELLRQGDKLAIRVRDPGSPALQAFKGLDFYPPELGYRVEARLVGDAKTLPMTTGLGAHVDERCPGTLEMTVQGQRVTLDPIIEADAPQRLFLIFKDLTNSDTTYGAGRFLYTRLPDEDGRVVVDFNQAYNPPCALTEHASCPVTPMQNRLPIRIEAGEKRFALHTGEGH